MQFGCKWIYSGLDRSLKGWWNSSILPRQLDEIPKLIKRDKSLSFVFSEKYLSQNDRYILQLSENTSQSIYIIVQLRLHVPKRTDYTMPPQYKCTLFRNFVTTVLWEAISSSVSSSSCSPRILFSYACFVRQRSVSSSSSYFIYPRIVE